MKKVLMRVILFVLIFSLSNKASALSFVKNKSTISKNEDRPSILFKLQLESYRKNLKEKFIDREKISHLPTEELKSELEPVLEASKEYLRSKGILEAVIEEYGGDENNVSIINFAVSILPFEDSIDNALGLPYNPSINSERDEWLEHAGNCISHALGFGTVAGGSLGFASWIIKHGVKTAIRLAGAVLGVAVGFIAISLLIIDFIDCMST